MLDEEACLEIDGIGIFIEYDKKIHLTPDLIRKHFQVVRDSSCIVEADSPKEAIHKFYENWHGAQIGGPEEHAKALWIDCEKPIIELVFCKCLRVSSENRFICGEQVRGECFGVRGMCVLEGYDPPDECPIDEMHVGELLKAKVLKKQRITVDGKSFLFINCNKKTNDFLKPFLFNKKSFK